MVAALLPGCLNYHFTSCPAAGGGSASGGGGVVGPAISGFINKTASAWLAGFGGALTSGAGWGCLAFCCQCCRKDGSG